MPKKYNAYVLPHSQDALNLLEYNGFQELPPAMTENSTSDFNIVAVVSKKKYFVVMADNLPITAKLINTILGQKTFVRSVEKFREILENG